MSVKKAAIDQALDELSTLAETYAGKAKELSRDPYIHEAIVKISVSSFVWKLFDTFGDDFGREALLRELIEQTEAVRREVRPEGGLH